ncbi:MAG: hypothetical protein ACRDUW_05040 [Pseudonocardiaceae bacterium]
MPILGLAVLAVFPLAWRIFSRIADVLIQPIINHFNAIDGDIPLPPADAADGVVRGRWDDGTGFSFARSSGVTAETFRNMVALVGEPPPLDEMRDLWKRGDLDYSALAEMFKFSRVRDDYFEEWVRASYHTMSGADAIEGRLKGVIDDATARDLFTQAGGLASQYDWILALAGNPIGVQQALNLWNHRLISEDKVTEVILHSRINPIFEPIAKLMRHRFLAPFQVSQALKAGGATAAEATQWLLDDGYPADQVAAIVREGSATKVAKHKDLTESQITELYDSGLFSHDDATQHLVALGYDPGETDFILAVYDQRRELTMAQAAVNQVRKVYLARRIDDAAALAMLGSLGVDATAQQNYLAIWKVEQESELKELTMAQVGSAFKKGLMTDTEAMFRWAVMGYSPADTAVLLGEYGGPPPAGSPAANAPAKNTPAPGA